MMQLAFLSAGMYKEAISFFKVEVKSSFDKILFLKFPFKAIILPEKSGGWFSLARACGLELSLVLKVIECQRMFMMAMQLSL